NYYRSTNAPKDSKSICRDILAVDPNQRLALRMLALPITDHFLGGVSDRYREAEEIFQRLSENYDRLYYTGILYERRAKAQLCARQSPPTLLPLFERALQNFCEAEKIPPAGNDASIPSWNRFVRL